MDRSNYNYGGYGGGRGRGRGRGGGRGVDGGGRGEDGDGTGGGRGRGGYFRGGRGRNYQHPRQYNQEYDLSQSQYGGGRGRSGGGNQQYDQSQSKYGGGRGRSGGGNQQYDQSQSQYGGGRGRSGGGNGGGGRIPRSPAWQGERTNQMPDPGERTWARVATSESVDSSNLTQLTQSSLADLQIQEVPKVEAWRVSSAKDGTVNVYRPIRRPDKGGTIQLRSIHLFANHFKVGFDPANTMLHYDVEVTREEVPLSWAAKKPIQKSDLRLIREKLCSDEPGLFPLLKTAYDGEKNIFSAVQLPTGSYKVQVFDGNDSKGRSYIFTIKLVNEVRQSKLMDYLNGNLLQMPRDVLQGMDLVMKENLFRNKVSVGKGGRGFYPREYRKEDDLYCGVAAFRGFQQSLKPTSSGLALCLDYSILAFRKRMPVIDFLKEHIQGFRGVSDVWRLRRDVVCALRGLKVTVTHRRTKQKYTISGLTDRSTKDISFKLEDPEGKEEPTEVMLLTYFQQKWGKEVVHKDIPCLDVGNSKKPNYVPMEFCVLAEDRRYPKEELGKEAARKLKDLSLLAPRIRRSEICRMMQEEYGSDACGATIENFGFGVDLDMTPVLGRVLPPPNLKLGNLNGGIRTTTVDKDKCHWNLLAGKTVVDGKAAERWALIDFTDGERNRLNSNYFIGKLMNRCGTLGVRMEEPLVVYTTDMREFESVDRLYGLLSHVKQEARKKSDGDLQIVVCVMAYKDDGYKSLKWVSETKIGVITQCCLSFAANKANDQYLANLGMKINAKLGGSNVELIERLPLFEHDDHFMFIGADVNHPAASNKTCPSIAAVVASVNWPAATRYAARVSPQRHRQEEIANFGSICLDLVNTYGRLNGMKPNKIVVFRDGVSDGQFDMVLNRELVDLKKAIYSEHYRPTVTIVVAQKRHITRLFPSNERDVMQPGNVPPGTVVDTTIVHPFEFDFYLSSHFGGLGTSKPTHYSVLWDENGFNSNEIQKLVYYLCFTFARCTKPVSLVPPVYYADLVAYRGRMFQEVAMDLSPGSVSSSSSRASASSSSSAASSFNQAFYDLEPQLKNCMFFV